MSTAKVDRIEQRANTNLPVNLLPVTAFAWVNFTTVSGVVGINGSHNISSITDIAGGVFGPRFTVQANTTAYSAVSTAIRSGSALLLSSGREGISLAGFTVHSLDVNGVSTDPNDMNVVVFGGQ